MADVTGRQHINEVDCIKNLAPVITSDRRLVFQRVTSISWDESYKVEVQVQEP
jgi:hypothetical protein